MATIAAMKESRPFHTFKDEYITAMVERSTLSLDDKGLIEQFLKVHRAKSSKPMSPGRVKKIYYHLIAFRGFLNGDFSRMTFMDLVDTKTRIEESGRFKQNTYRDCIAIVKMFLAWLIKAKRALLTLEELHEITIPGADKRRMRPEDRITDEEKDRMIAACTNTRDKAIISLFWEGGLRPVEIGRLRACDVEFQEDRKTMIVYVREKTERTRRIPCPITMHYMKAWYNVAPYPIKDETLVFPCLTPRVNEKGGRTYLGLKDDALRNQLKEIARRAGVTRYKHPYQFRHSAISRLINAGVPLPMVMELSHGGPTQMMGVYWHASGQEIEDVVNEKVHGIAPRKGRVVSEDRITERICITCGAMNPKEFRFCGACGLPLTEEARVSLQTATEKVEADPLFKIALAAMLQALKQGTVTPTPGTTG